MQMITEASSIVPAHCSAVARANDQTRIHPGRSGLDRGATNRCTNLWVIFDRFAPHPIYCPGDRLNRGPNELQLVHDDSLARQTPDQFCEIKLGVVGPPMTSTWEQAETWSNT